MTIAKGRAWGRPEPLPANGVVVHSDAEARAVVEAARGAGAALPCLGLLGGDLCTTLGGRGDQARLRAPEAVSFPIDVIRVCSRGTCHWFVAHLVAHNRMWTRTTGVMNAAWLGRWNPAPRAHPNDGLVDVVEARLRPGDLRAVRSRLAQGAHLPHPRITTRRVPVVELDLRGMQVWLDGSRVDVGPRVEIVVEPDALTVVV